MLDDREVGEETRANRRRVQLTLVLLAVGCATGGGTATPSLRVDHGKLAARMGIVQKLSEPAEPVPAEPVDRHERSTEGLGGAVPTNTRAPEGRLRGLGGALPSPGEPAGGGGASP